MHCVTLLLIAHVAVKWTAESILLLKLVLQKLMQDGILASVETATDIYEYIEQSQRHRQADGVKSTFLQAFTSYTDQSAQWGATAVSCGRGNDLQWSELSSCTIEAELEWGYEDVCSV